MLFYLHCEDKPGTAALRARTRPAHLDYVKEFQHRIVLGGPTLAADGATPTGSVIVMEFPDIEAAQVFANGDPYAKAGLFAHTTITPFRLVFKDGKPAG